MAVTERPVVFRRRPVEEAVRVRDASSRVRKVFSARK